MSTKTKTSTKSNRENRQTESVSHTFLSDDILDKTLERYRRVQKQYGQPFEKSVQDLLAQNDRAAVAKRLERAGLSSKNAEVGARLVSDRASIPPEVFSGTPGPNVNRAERVLGINDLIDVRFLLTGAERTASVGRIRLQGGFATGFLIAPGVVMTNHHVFRRARDARGARIEFGFRETNLDGDLSTPTTFAFDVSRLFFTDRELDVSVVALGDRLSGDVDALSLPVCELMNEPDLVISGERLNIIQHPAGEPKQVALRDNTAIAVLDETFLHYRTDTKRGSSGSPVFNDEWDLVGLHHAGVPEKDEDGNFLDIDGNIATNNTPDHRIAWIANEAIQSSALFRLLGNLDLDGEAQDLVDSILEPADSSETDTSTVFAPAFDRPNGLNRLDRRPADGTPSSPVSTPTSIVGVPQADGTVRVSIPVEISIKLGDALATTGVGGISGTDTADGTGLMELSRFLERFDIDDDYSNRNGYRDGFLDEELPLPGLTDDQTQVAAQNREPIDGDEPHVLRYHNFSVVMNAERKIPFFTAVNIHGGKLIRLRRKDEGGEHRWISESRIGAHEQTNNDHYKGRENRLDRGHLVRRLDPGWGDTDQDSARGIVDTFHYANCAPQYDRFNRKSDSPTGPANGLWLGLENFALNKADDNDHKVSVFSGPVFRKSDPDFADNGVKIPTQFWKIIAWCDDAGELQAAAFLLTQKKMLKDDPRIERMGKEAFDFRERELFQTTVAHIAQLTDLDFGPLEEAGGGADESFTRGSTPQPLPIERFDEIKFA